MGGGWCPNPENVAKNYSWVAVSSKIHLASSSYCNNCRAFWKGTSMPGYTNKGTVLSKTPLRLILLLLIPDLHNFITRFLTTLHINLVISAISRSICSLSSCPSSSVLLVTSLTAALYSRNRCRSSSMMAASVFCEGVEKRVIIVVQTFSPKV